ncbi:molybdopterin molybdotransferase MoeA [Lutimaribacter sp. EGI FJ00015]|uniref:Molybdopterin molybdotransferase MoeA n=1 Tax=Lutimaribacter degradans TaxID=2945989 RepID=A0ACC5ZYS3_9RHOB|nr:gephyrin-like molybdotransferase Glp [Lutimaribacter sp. EGI FJ00013]MCM2563338.1 molybdopterin molybdotransferase MoeA [Lutimaribacter sp. EGI FJ00013]MCO0614584.1 molybdopterin molybdotransferase MoeA [Lutimaribacter sp. EGI FJ00015]MCO0637256.1 molybdopterin molybdotransferase MoeA [Lutimaribacter sp. EGI FJ00014]
MAGLAACSTGKPGPILSVDAARLRAVTAACPVTGLETLSLDAAVGRVTAGSTTAASALPPFDNSAMDGYALCMSDLAGDGPWRLPVSARITAGDGRALTLSAGSVARIFTGAPVPLGADAVVMQEHVTRSGNMITVSRPPRCGQNIRRRGEDVAQGALALGAGRALTPQRLALLAGCGVASVAVRARVRVAILSTGNELAEPGQPRGPGQIYNSNRVLLRATLSRLPWVDLADLGILPDDPGSIRGAIRLAAKSNDVIISSGGVSAGEEDHILDALRAEAAELDVLKVAIRPGKPLTVGRLGQALYFGLPGNPYAAAITLSQIARPALNRVAGLTEGTDAWLPAVAGFTYSRRTGRREYVPVTWSGRDPLGRPIIARLGQGASASLSPIAQAMGIAVIPQDMDVVRPGQPLSVEPLSESALF